ncbi:MAG: hypothetical protein E7157_03590 [Lactobacillales bacterium]|nr:hypothetical protein [Lactobacillales bacterium]
MNNYEKFLNYRKQYDTFIYEKYEIIDNPDNYEIIYYFSIPNLTEFTPKISIDKTNLINENINKDFINYLVFNIGMIEVISYVKCTCSKNIIVKAGHLDDEQIKWFKKLYYNGLGEFLYVNNIKVEEDELFTITSLGDKIDFDVTYKGIGNLIPIGGGKDSNVTLELLKDDYENNTCFIINPKEANVECAKVANYQDKSINIKRIIDKRLIDLNNEGYLNGHTPFSAVVAFISYLCAYLSNKEYIVLSNEDSANESTVLGTNINHQYSKTYEFENDFNNYTKKYFKINIKYFSLLRPLTEFQIGMLFSNYKKYHKIFKSCNVGSKEKNWNWCNHCPKCLFVYIILSPFLYKEELVNIFGKDLYDDESLLDTFKELLGYAETKPFECVGTYEEVRYSVSLLIDKLQDNLPYLLNYYKENYPLYLEQNYKIKYNKNNNLDEKFENIIKEELNKYV